MTLNLDTIFTDMASMPVKMTLTQHPPTLECSRYGHYACHVCRSTAYTGRKVAPLLRLYTLPDRSTAAWYAQSPGKSATTVFLGNESFLGLLSPCIVKLSLPLQRSPNGTLLLGKKPGPGTGEVLHEAYMATPDDFDLGYNCIFRYGHCQVCRSNVYNGQ